MDVQCRKPCATAIATAIAATAAATARTYYNDVHSVKHISC
jgi:hypothetical protein